MRGGASPTSRRLAPLPPAAHEGLADVVIALDDAGPGEEARPLDMLGEAQRQDALRVGQLAHQGDVAGLGPLPGPGHAAVPVEVLPAVRGPHIAGAGPAEAVLGGEAERVVVGHRIELVLDPGGIVPAVAAEMGRQQHVEPALGLQAVVDEQHVPLRVGEDLEDQAVALALVHDLGQGDVRPGRAARVVVGALDLDPVAVVEADDEAQIADLRAAGRGPEDLVDDAEAERRPEAARALAGGRDEVLGAGRPGRCDAGPARRQISHSQHSPPSAIRSGGDGPPPRPWRRRTSRSAHRPRARPARRGRPAGSASWHPGG